MALVVCVFGTMTYILRRLLIQNYAIFVYNLVVIVGIATYNFQTQQKKAGY